LLPRVQKVAQQLNIAEILSSALYLTFGGIILLSLKRPLSRYTTLLPNLVAVLAGFVVYVFALMPNGNVLRVSVYVALFFVVSGTIVILISLVFLRQAFSITPQGRFLVTSGPYALVRHPMYIGNVLWLFGLALLIDSWEAIGLFFVCAALQVCRAFYEESLLQSTFLEYTNYKSRVGRFFPRLKFGWRLAFPLLGLVFLASTSPGDTATPILYVAGTGTYPSCFHFNCSSPEVNDSVESPLIVTKQPLLQLAANNPDLAVKCKVWYQKAVTDSWFNPDEEEEVSENERKNDRAMHKIPSCKQFEDLVDLCTQDVFRIKTEQSGGEPIFLPEIGPKTLMDKLEEHKGCVALAGFDTVCRTLEAIAKKGMVLSEYRRNLMVDCFSKELRQTRMSLLKPAV
jgi:protein-S-isoprenylcysteine O-methyltransferase Ste14